MNRSFFLCLLWAPVALHTALLGCASNQPTPSRCPESHSAPIVFGPACGKEVQPELAELPKPDHVDCPLAVLVPELGTYHLEVRLHGKTGVIELKLTREISHVSPREKARYYLPAEGEPEPRDAPLHYERKLDCSKMVCEDFVNIVGDQHNPLRLRIRIARFDYLHVDYSFDTSSFKAKAFNGSLSLTEDGVLSVDDFAFYLESFRPTRPFPPRRMP